MNETENKQDSPTMMSSGAGIAIAGIWLAASAVTIFILYIAFGTPGAQAADYSGMDLFGFAILVLIVSLPMIAAYKMSKLILSKDD